MNLTPQKNQNDPQSGLVFNIQKKCIGISECGRCLRACKEKAVKRGGDEKIRIDRRLCRHCGECIDTCPSEALTLFGETLDVDEVIKIVEQDSLFYRRSGGGLTVGGGEPLSQGDFVVSVFEAAKGRGLDTALETSGYGDWKILKMNSLQEALGKRIRLTMEMRTPERDEKGPPAPGRS
jgi:pyruvate formate lyase activating enzyme